MINIGLLVFLFVLGAALGSFGCCQAWRLCKRDKSKWSHCMNCKYRLQWYDNIPIVSWLMLRGKCRKCRKKIGYAEILAEVGLGAVFAASFWWWPERALLLSGDFVEVLKFGIFLVNLVVLLILFVYDAKWKELPVKLMLVTIGLAAAYLALDVVATYGLGRDFDWLSVAGALAVLPGFYYLMYKISRERWVGGGDWILCIAIALMLENVWLALMTLFAANIIGSIVALPILIKKKDGNIAVPFGPFLIIGFLLIFFCQEQILKLVMF